MASIGARHPETFAAMKRGFWRWWRRTAPKRREQDEQGRGRWRTKMERHELVGLDLDEAFQGDAGISFEDVRRASPMEVGPEMLRRSYATISNATGRPNSVREMSRSSDIAKAVRR